MQGGLARLQASLDEVELSGLRDEERAAVRAERKAVTATLEALVPEARALCSDILAARKAMP